MLGEDMNKENEGESSDSVDYDSDDPTSTYERRVLKMKRRRVRAFLSEFNDGDAVKASDLIPIPTPRIEESPIKKRKRTYKRRYSTPMICFAPRKSQRLSKSPVDYSGLDSDYTEPPVYKPSKGRRYRRRSTTPRSVEFNLEALSGTICYTSQKVYSQSGTTCHQCRQKTLDLKSRCYDPYCRGVRGMFCGYCLLQRYGEDVAVVLRDPSWKCPPCRKICNCSICRRSYGKEPTGILFPSVNEKGYGNVLDYLAKIGDDKLGDDTDDDKFEEDVDDDADDDKLEDDAEADNWPDGADDESCTDGPPTKRQKPALECYVKLERLNISLDEDLSFEFKGF